MTPALNGAVMIWPIADPMDAIVVPMSTALRDPAPDTISWPPMLNGAATGAYIGAHLGPGPRDGLMMGLVRRSGLSVRLIRTAIELSALGAGWLLGGTVGIGTLLYAVTIGWLVQLFLPLFDPRRREPARTATRPT